jgi:GT2 family glycosyltransferase/2-polyprenyl-3-methyl-5-hydroxy-6-metoxy-1,4-benzoquinol methylase
VSDPVVVPRADDPLVSVVFVTHGGWEWLRRALAALRDNTDRVYEVIVVDSASPDDTAQRLRTELDGVRLELHDENIGFARACNAGADLATGRYLCFLNIDALVEPGWLPPLLEQAEQPRTGAVFPMLLEPDGTVQEAGSVVDSLGWAHALGAGRAPESFALRFTRAIDYGSAACMLVERRQFAELGGFDPAYGAGYYEDADFCFRLRAHGLRSVYEPRSRVVHARHGASSSERARELMLANRGHFYAHWASALAQRPRLTEIATNPRHALAARDADARERILVIDDRVPFSDRGSGDPRMAKMLLELVDLWPDSRVTLLAAEPTDAELYAEPLLARGIEVEVAADPSQLGDWFDERLFHYGVVVVSRPQNVQRFEGWLERTQPQALRVYDIEALASRRLERQELFAADGEERDRIRLEAGRTRIVEGDFVRTANALFCVSTEEMTAAREHAPDKPAFIVSSYVDVVEPVPGFHEREGAIFFGGFLAGAGSPNEDSLLHLVHDVMPAVWDRHPDLLLTVVGADATPAVQALAGERVKVVGYVDDPVPWLARARVHASPVRFGAGIKLKLLDSMAAGLPFVTTPTGAEGLHLEPVRDAVVAEPPGELARLIDGLLSDEARWQRVQQHLLHVARTQFSRTAFRTSLVRAFSHLGVAPPRGALADRNVDGAARTALTGRLWGSAAREKAETDAWQLRYWQSHPLTTRHIARGITGTPGYDWLVYTKERFGARRRGLSLGCGNGVVERAALAIGLCERFDAFDLSAEAISVAEQEADRAGVASRITYRIADLNTIELAADTYDFAIAAQSLHHVEGLEHVLDEVAASLTDDGIFIVQEYVGPSRFQSSEEAIELMNRVLDALPEELRLEPGTKTVRRAFRPASAEAVAAADPSEAIRSAEIVPLLEERFEIVYRADFGGTLLHLPLAGILVNFDPDDPKDAALVDLMSLYEETLIERGALKSDFTYIAARRRPTTTRSSG